MYMDAGRMQGEVHARAGGCSGRVDAGVGWMQGQGECKLIW